MVTFLLMSDSFISSAEARIYNTDHSYPYHDILFLKLFLEVSFFFFFFDETPFDYDEPSHSQYPCENFIEDCILDKHCQQPFNS